MSNRPEEQGKSETNDAANPHPHVVCLEQTTASDGRYLPYFRLRFAMMTCVIFTGWIYNVFFSLMWTTAEGKPLTGVIMGLLYLPMMLGALPVLLVLDLNHASSAVFSLTMIIYGLVVSPLIARLFYRGWHGKGRNSTVPAQKLLDHQVSERKPEE